MNYFVVGTNDIDAASSFYDSLFKETGVSKIIPAGRMVVWGTDDFMFAVAQPYNGEAATAGNGTMVGFNVGSAEEVKSLYEKALELGGVDEGGPEIRSGRYCAYVRDLDKNKICFFE